MQGLLAIYFLAFPTGEGQLEDRTGPWGGGPMEEQETEALVSFVRRAGQEIERRGGQTPPRLRAVAGCEAIRVTRSLRVYIGPRELKVRPMSKTVLLLFLRHPEGIPLKQIGDYRKELEQLYRRLNCSDNPETVSRRVLRILDFFNNELNVSISRVNAAISSLVEEGQRQQYCIGGRAGTPKFIPLDREKVIWE